MKCTFVHAIVQSIVIGWIQGLIFNVCEPVDFLNIYYQKMYFFVLFMWNIYETNVIIHVYLHLSLSPVYQLWSLCHCPDWFQLQLVQ